LLVGLKKAQWGAGATPALSKDQALTKKDDERYNQDEKPKNIGEGTANLSPRAGARENVVSR